MISFWTPERAEIVVELAGMGLLTREIGRRLGCTRNAVIGRLYRQGFRMRNTPEPPTIYDRLPNVNTGGCRWITGDVCGGEWSYCGARVAQPGGSWCATHRGRVFDKRKADV
jgi:GcrA cell cycle regulator